MLFESGSFGSRVYNRFNDAASQGASLKCGPIKPEGLFVCAIAGGSSTSHAFLWTPLKVQAPTVTDAYRNK